MKRLFIMIQNKRYSRLQIKGASKNHTELRTSPTNSPIFVRLILPPQAINGTFIPIQLFLTEFSFVYPHYLMKQGKESFYQDGQDDSSILPALHFWSSRGSGRATRKDIVARPTLIINFQLSNFQ